VTACISGKSGCKLTLMQRRLLVNSNINRYLQTAVCSNRTSVTRMHVVTYSQSRRLATDNILSGLPFNYAVRAAKFLKAFDD
jgi:hypothetical protein